MNFWDTGGKTVGFDFFKEKKLLLDNMEYLNSMTVEEQTLYKKWVELQEPTSIKSKSDFAKYYDWQWRPTDIYNKEQTIKEIEELEPYIEIVETPTGSTKWTYIRRMIHTMSWVANPGRNVKIFIIDKKSGKLLGLSSLASDVTSLGVRDKYIGWTKDDKFVQGKLNYTSIASTIVCTQPLGYNFLGGKLIAMMVTLPEIRDYWKKNYGQTLVAIGTTSLYGIHSQYNGIPHYKTLGESKGMISTKPDDKYYEPWHHWIKENRAEWYKKHITMERIRNGKSMGTGAGASGPVSGIKQKILSQIFKEIGIKSTTFNHGFKRGIYLAMMYDNGNEFLSGKIEEKDLVMKKKFEDGVDYINKWWKRHAIKRYTKLHDQGRIKPECLYYVDAVGIDWETMKDKYLSEVGR